MRVWLIALTWSVADLAMGADAAKPKPQKSDQDLGEVLVEGTREKPKRPGFEEYQAPFNFMARLVGEFVIDGMVELHAQGKSLDLLKVSGRAECVGFGIAPGVQCELKVRWPEATGPNGEEILGGVSTLNPAVVLYGFEPIDPNTVGITRRFPPGMPTVPTTPEEPGVSYILVDSDGVAETAVGQMINADIMQSRSKCLTVPGNCERLVRITAAPDLKTVEMKIDLAIDERPAVNYTFVMHRVPGTDSVVYGRKPEKEKNKK